MQAARNRLAAARSSARRLPIPVHRPSVGPLAHAAAADFGPLVQYDSKQHDKAGHLCT
jgi:hypothetical protein